jgi:hypothetical protein
MNNGPAMGLFVVFTPMNYPALPVIHGKLIHAKVGFYFCVPHCVV